MVLSADIVTYVICGYILEKLGSKVTLASMYTLSGIGGIVMLTYGLQHTDSIAFPIIFVACRFGISGIYIVFMAANARIFPPDKSATAFGCCACVARLVLCGAPLVSTMKQPIPMYIFTATTIMAICVSIFLKVHPKSEQRLNQSKEKKALEN